MARFDSLRRELGILPPLPEYEDVEALTAHIQQWASKPRPLAKALQRKVAAITRQNRAALQRIEDPRVAHRAKLAGIQKRVDDLIKNSKLSAAEGALLDVHMGNYARVHC